MISIIRFKFSGIYIFSLNNMLTKLVFKLKFINLGNCICSKYFLPNLTGVKNENHALIRNLEILLDH